MSFGFRFRNEKKVFFIHGEMGRDVFSFRTNIVSGCPIQGRSPRGGEPDETVPALVSSTLGISPLVGETPAPGCPFTLVVDQAYNTS